MKKNNNNQILYLSLPLYGKFTYIDITCFWIFIHKEPIVVLIPNGKPLSAR